MSIRSAAARLPKAVTAPLLLVATTLLFVGLWRLSGEPVTGLTWSIGVLIAANGTFVDARRARRDARTGGHAPGGHAPGAHGLGA
jgi:hypothetical protein